jgi:teichuronic acid biosynthesis glycosyltransferase TuaG
LPSEPFQVSVIIAHHNSSMTLRRALLSVSAQTYPVYEIIIIDDASLPDEQVRVQTLADTVPGARVVCLPHNLGPATARNIGWDQAAGDWIALLDSDDAWHPQKLELQVTAVKESSLRAGFVGTRMTQVPDVPATASHVSSPAVRVITRRTLLARNPFPTPSVLMRADLPVRFPEGERYCEDYSLWMAVSSLGVPMLRIEAPLTLTFKHPYGDGGLSRDMRAMWQGEVRAFRRARYAGWISAAEYVLSRMVLATRISRQYAIHRTRAPFPAEAGTEVDRHA